MKMEFVGTRQRGHPSKTWWDCVKADMERFGLSCEDAQDRDYLRLRIKGEPTNPGLAGKRPLKRCVCVCLTNRAQTITWIGNGVCGWV